MAGLYERVYIMMTVMMMLSSSETSQHGAARRLLPAARQPELSRGEELDQTGPQPTQVSINDDPNPCLTMHLRDGRGPWPEESHGVLSTVGF